MNPVFGSVYASAYDALYQDKDYASECDRIERLLKEHSPKPIRTILDLGCGTGNHAIPLAQRGYRVTGVDRSEDMLLSARKKSQGLSIDFQTGDVRSIDLNQRFDAVLMMFAVLGYQIENEDVRAALRTVRSHLVPNGIFLFDVWYGPTVLQEKPSAHEKHLPAPTGRISRFATSDLDTARHLCTVHYRLQTSRDGRPEEISEHHPIRYFFPQELRLFLGLEGLSLIRIGSFTDFDRDPDLTTWNVLAAARALEP